MENKSGYDPNSYITKAMIRLYVYPVSKMICLGKWYEYLVQGRVYDYHAYIQDGQFSRRKDAA